MRFVAALPGETFARRRSVQGIFDPQSRPGPAVRDMAGWYPREWHYL